MKKQCQSRVLKGTVKADEFLKAHEKTGHLGDTASGKFQRPIVKELKPSVPKRDEAPVHGIGSGRNFIVTNAVEAILAAPRRPPKREYEWLKKPDYGQAPAYLDRIKAEVKEEHDYLEQLLKHQGGGNQEKGTQPGLREMTTTEREELLTSLKLKYDAVMKVYQLYCIKKISASTATIGEIRAKETCEKQLESLEADIKRLSIKAPIYIVDDGAGAFGASAAAFGASRTM